ncbi:MAG: tetratricopeptide repeat protein, partial [Anaerolineales bacterium]
VLRQMLNNYDRRDALVALWLELLGESLLRQGRWDEAYQAYVAAIEKNEDREWLQHIGMGRALTKGNQAPEAIEAEFHKAIALAPDQAEGFDAMGDFYMMEGRYGGAVRMYGEAIFHVPREHQKYLGWLYLKRGRAALAGSDLSTAVNTLKVATSMFPEDPELHFLLAQAYFRLDNAPLAIQMLDQSLSLGVSPSVGRLMHAARLYEQAGDSPRALEAYCRALALDPENEAAQAGVKRHSQ